MNNLRRNPWLATLLGVLVSALFLVFALRGARLHEIGSALRAANLWLAAPFLASLFLYYWVKTVRWADLLSPVGRATARELFPAVMIGYAGSALLPMQLGELARSYLVARRMRVAGLAVLMSIALERVFDLLSILLLLGIALAFGGEFPPVLISAGYLIGIVTLAAGLLFVAYVYRTERFVALARWFASRLPARFGERFVRQIEAGAGGLQALRNGMLLLRLMATSLLQWVFMWLCVWLSLAAVGVAVPAVAAFVTLVLMVIGISLPNSPGYIGSIQLAYVLALKPFGIDAEAAIAASVFFHVLAYASVVLAGLVFVHRLGVGWRNLADAAQERAS